MVMEVGILALAAGALCREARSTQVFFLQGGYEAFSASCPELCSKQSTPTGLSLPLSTSVPDSAESGCSSCSTPLYDQGGPVEILSFLYLGSAYHASRKDMLDALGITALINVSANCPNHFEGHCSAEAGSPAMAVLDRGTSTTTVFNFPVSIPVHPTNSALNYLKSPITTSPSC